MSKKNTKKEQPETAVNTPATEQPLAAVVQPPAGQTDETLLHEQGVSDIHVDPEFAALIPPHSDEELALLEKSVKAEGCRDPVVVWGDDRIVVEGHTRLKLCRKHNIPFSVVSIELPDREAAKMWILNTQFARRNLTPDATSYLRGKAYNALKLPHGGERKAKGARAQNELSNRTAAELGGRFGVSTTTIRRDGQFAEAVDKITEVCGEEAQRTILGGKHGLTQQEVLDLAEQEAGTVKETLRRRISEGRKPRKGKEKSSDGGSATGSSISKDEPPASGNASQNLDTASAVVEQEGVGNGTVTPPLPLKNTLRTSQRSSPRRTWFRCCPQRKVAGV